MRNKLPSVRLQISKFCRKIIGIRNIHNFFRLFITKPRLLYLLLVLHSLNSLIHAEYFQLQANDYPRRFEWKLEKDDVIELNEFHNVLFRIKNSEIRRQDKNRINLVADECNTNACKIKGRFDTYVRFGSSNQPFRKEKTFLSTFYIQKDGTYIVPEEFIVPNLRSVPAFPGSELSPGDSWTMPAEEGFDFQSGRFKISVQAKYKLVGVNEWKWNEHSGIGDLIHYSYPIFYLGDSKDPNLPIKVYGFARGSVYFDLKTGVPQFKENKLTYTFVYSDGRVTEANFHIHGVYKSRKTMNQLAKQELKDSIRSDLGLTKDISGSNSSEHSKLPNLNTTSNQQIDVRNTDDGISISMDSILFDTDKYILKEEAYSQIEKIANVLKKYPDREIRVSGHTDNRGGSDYNIKLSENRAKEVVDLLIKRYGVEEKRLSYQGLGDSFPLSSNSTEDGRAKNRRVDITLMVE